MVVTGQAVPLILVMLEVMFGQQAGFVFAKFLLLFKNITLGACLYWINSVCLISSLMLRCINIYLLLIISIF